jgi:S-adenosylmethionine:tRNA ribosyltransferase-isomerase
MKLNDLDYTYPEELVATEPQRPSRVMWVENGQPIEITVEELLKKIPADDVLVINNTQVLKRRLFAGDIEILFLDQLSELEWEVLFPSKKFSIGDELELPQGVRMQLLVKGRPQRVRVSQVLTEDYFSEVAELPLPPYIQKARGERHAGRMDTSWYQTAWAEKPGSLAAPTASLHFTARDLETLRSQGVRILPITLHVGLGTFLPVTTDDLRDHVMHEEYVHIPASVWKQIQEARKQGASIWAMGTTVARALESVESGLLQQNEEGSWSGFTRLLIQPGFAWKVVDRLLTNFHQPQSTLLALVAGFSNLDRVKACYRWAIEKKFRLFSYGDLSVWIPEGPKNEAR